MMIWTGNYRLLTRNLSSILLKQNCKSSCSSTRRGALWDDSDWMNHNDSNTEAYQSNDITKLRPFPEFRNVAIGPVWGPNAFESTWKIFFQEQTLPQQAKQQKECWNKFTEENGFTPEEYFRSQDFEECYGNNLIWESYVRNHKGSRQSQKTRKSCYRNGQISTGSPCPICRDEKILINFKNLMLLYHFIDPYSGQLYHAPRTGVCQKKQTDLENAVQLSRDQGLLFRPSTFVQQQSILYQTQSYAAYTKK